MVTQPTQTSLPIEVFIQRPLLCEFDFQAVCELCGTVGRCHSNSLWFGGAGWRDRTSCCDERACERRRGLQ